MTPGVILLIALVCALAGSGIGRPKGRATLGFFLGLLLGAIGVVIIAFVKPDHEHLVMKEQERILIEEEARRGLRE